MRDFYPESSNHQSRGGKFISPRPSLQIHHDQLNCLLSLSTAKAYEIVWYVWVAWSRFGCGTCVRVVAGVRRMVVGSHFGSNCFLFKRHMVHTCVEGFAVAGICVAHGVARSWPRYVWRSLHESEADGRRLLAPTLRMVSCCRCLWWLQRSCVVYRHPSVDCTWARL